jgi:uncharacterized OB-fold protein
MALRRCPDCGWSVSSQAVKCPRCGRERFDVTLPGSGWLWVLIVLAAFTAAPFVVWWVNHR